MATKQHGRRAAEAKVKTPLTELTELLNANSGVFGRRAAVVAASGGLLTAAVLPAAGQGADDSVAVSAEAEASPQAEFQNQTATVSADKDSKDKKSEKKADSFGIETQTVTAKAAPKPEPKPTPSETATADSDESANSGASTSGNSGDKSESKDSGSSDDAGSIDGSKAEQVLAWAAKGVGTPYVSGGTSQSGWDCSGYTSWVYGKVGVNLPRTSGAQKGAGKVVSASEAKPGDIIWHPGHVGIYAGGGQMYDAGSPSSGTSKRSYSWMGNVTFIRVL
ncbi:C40 family peptidase [Brevibacterium sp. GP-SGM9]|uniref:C40 family peptidase n=1 Tax=unclassified Brevibacterium TaxID=2614124 RepID=UPI001E415A7D|nr:MULTISPECIES: C40 family peptidase [unclassified Brevibacterium]MCD1285433.1 glycoside hydrolase [Brevibacterium sp. CCUG 69071]MDK8434483.1 C40 family peptidase [Brevibacterium sp. H-BE7]